MIHEIKEKKTPELNDDFVATLNIKDVNTVEELKKHQKETLAAQKKQQALNAQFGEILKTICDNATVEIADKVLETEADRMKQDMIAQIEQNGLTFEQYKEITGMNDEQIAEQFKADAKNRLTEYVVINEIGRVENLVITRAEIDEYYANVAKQYNMSVEDVKKAFGSNEGRIVEQLFINKIERFIIANNGDVAEETKVEETKAEEKPAKKPAAKKTTKKTTKKVEEKTEEPKAE